ncbi:MULTISPECIES: hypothetical protein [unclassified Candidatus Paralachnospira]|uniref:hypothetical protein n=1 Tax=unclassified Candidatus Paralachnospira TaxID=3099471 RepID=UPI003F8F1CB9
MGVCGCSPGKGFYLEAQVCYSNGTTRSHRFDFDPYVKGWQYGGGVFTTDDGDAGTQNRYYAIHIRIVYDDQCNAAWFDGVQLTKDEGETYVYDNDGNLTDVKSAAEQSKFRYDGNGNLSGMVSPDGTDFSYTYDSWNNLTEAKNSDGAV